MPSRAYTSFLLKRIRSYEFIIKQCQCPLGLIPHFYVSMKLLLYCIYACVNALSGLYLISTVCIQENRPSIQLCQCPLGLIPHFYVDENGDTFRIDFCVNALSGLYLISTIVAVVALTPVSDVSMPSRAYTSFLRYPFKNLGFMRFPEPVFAGIYQNILTTAVFRAC